MNGTGQDQRDDPSGVARAALVPQPLQLPSPLDATIFRFRDWPLTVW